MFFIYLSIMNFLIIILFYVIYSLNLYAEDNPLIGKSLTCGKGYYFFSVDRFHYILPKIITREKSLMEYLDEKEKGKKSNRNEIIIEDKSLNTEVFGLEVKDLEISWYRSDVPRECYAAGGVVPVCPGSLMLYEKIDRVNLEIKSWIAKGPYKFDNGKKFYAPNSEEKFILYKNKCKVSNSVKEAKIKLKEDKKKLLNEIQNEEKQKKKDILKKEKLHKERMKERKL